MANFIVHKEAVGVHGSHVTYFRVRRWATDISLAARGSN